MSEGAVTNPNYNVQGVQRKLPELRLGRLLDNSSR